MYNSRTKVPCPKCGTRAHIVYIDKARQFGNWETHQNAQGRRCDHSNKKALASKFRGL